MKGFVLSAESPVKRSMKLFFVHGQETCICCNSNIEPCYEGGNDNVFVDLFDELGFLESS